MSKTAPASPTVSPAQRQREPRDAHPRHRAAAAVSFRARRRRPGMAVLAAALIAAGGAAGSSPGRRPASARPFSPSRRSWTRVTSSRSRTSPTPPCPSIRRPQAVPRPGERNQCRCANARSTTQRLAPSPDPCPVPRRAISGYRCPSESLRIIRASKAHPQSAPRRNSTEQLSHQLPLPKISYSSRY